MPSCSGGIATRSTASSGGGWTSRPAPVEGYRNLNETVMSLAEFLLTYGPTLLLWTLLLWFPARYGFRRFRLGVHGASVAKDA